MNNNILKLIIESMRNEISDKETYLESLKKLTVQKTNNATCNSIKKEILEIDNHLKNEHLIEDEKNEFKVIKIELNKILKAKIEKK
jgi:hypothetical protein